MPPPADGSASVTALGASLRSAAKAPASTRSTEPVATAILYGVTSTVPRTASGW